MLFTLNLQNENDPLVQWALTVIFRLRGAWGALILVTDNWVLEAPGLIDPDSLFLRKDSCEQELRDFVAHGGNSIGCVLFNFRLLIGFLT